MTFFAIFSTPHGPLMIEFKSATKESAAADAKLYQKKHYNLLRIYQL